MIEINYMNLTVLLGMIGPWQIVIIIAVLILLFGEKKIPELMKGVGKGIKEFKFTMYFIRSYESHTALIVT